MSSPAIPQCRQFQNCQNALQSLYTTIPGEDCRDSYQVEGVLPRRHHKFGPRESCTTKSLSPRESGVESRCRTSNLVCSHYATHPRPSLSCSMASTVCQDPGTAPMASRRLRGPQSPPDEVIFPTARPPHRCLAQTLAATITVPQQQPTPSTPQDIPTQ